MPENLTQKNTIRPPVVAIMGHIDHGKSTLLDHIRKTNIAAREVGGITQHVSAYEVRRASSDLPAQASGGSERVITFLDTPGHAAFSGIRERGVLIADIAVLIVSAEDGVKPQTLEALEAIKDAGIPFIVAMNKIDRPEASIERTKASLAENGIYIEGYGGDIPAVAISAKTGQGIDELLDMVNLVADLQEFQGDPSKDAEGYVLESNLDPKKGIAATLVIKDGSIRRGQTVAAGNAIAPVRIMENFLGKSISEASFSSPIRIIGWDRLPAAGSTFKVFDLKNDAIKHAAMMTETMKNAVGDTHAETTPNQAVLPIVLKADVAGSLEAVQKELEKLSTDKILVKTVISGIGTITENDIKAAEGSDGVVIIGFNTKPDATAKNSAIRNNIEIHTFDIIYKLTEWFEELVKARTPKLLAEKTTGSAKVLKFFSAVKDKQVIGGRVENGTVRQNASVKIVRRDIEIGSGKIKELQQNKSKVSSVDEGNEFGMQVEASVELAPGDRIECVEMVET